MAESASLRDPWLVAVWPGMGSVALLAGSYLLQELDAQRVNELDTREYFEVQGVDVSEGIAKVGRLPRSMFFEWRDPRGRHDLLLFLGEAQPNTNGYDLCHEVIDYASRRGVKRLFTFAAMATQLNPGNQPRVFAVATDAPTLKQIERLEVEVLQEGQITGLNGTLLAAGAERGISGVCLMGELPYFAVGVPNPRAAEVVLRQFVKLAGIEVEFTELEQQAESVDRNLQQLLAQMSQAAGMAMEAEDEDEQGNGGQAAPAEKKPELDPKTLRRIEMMFDRARQDRSKAFELKHELDRLGVFKQYEDRFLDLFRSGG